jgi:cadmium resistance protein CadD (predicted permease)
MKKQFYSFEERQKQRERATHLFVGVYIGVMCIVLITLIFLMEG